MVPPIRLYFSIPLMRRFCKVPGEIFRISRTSGYLSQGLGNSEDDLFFLLMFLISRSSRFPKFNKSRFVTIWWFSSSIFSVSGNRALWLKFIMLCFEVIWYKTIAFEKEKFPSCYQLGNDFYVIWLFFVGFSLNRFRFWFPVLLATDLKIGFDLFCGF